MQVNLPRDDFEAVIEYLLHAQIGLHGLARTLR